MALSPEIEKNYKELLSKITVRKAECEEFVEFLEKETTWLTAPASTKYHLSIEHGLIIHSISVAMTMLSLKNSLIPEIPDESCVIVGLFHDVGKIGMPHAPRYLKKNSSHYVYNEQQVEMSSAARSLYLVSKFISLTDEEAQAILYHDGQYILENRPVAHKECHLTLLVTFADTWEAAKEDGRLKVKQQLYFTKRIT
ncbi:MAG: HD domain-containing protein [Candidatus Omnitrophica bacterium]|nr:HD domain-containing protein [Candidatus Omnitrophota bacterium]MCM8788488.1 HD domain-containing protein [Candidatus Omnitrophota bacterium]